jgi:hypothetical protein
MFGKYYVLLIINVKFVGNNSIFLDFRGKSNYEIALTDQEPRKNYTLSYIV